MAPKENAGWIYAIQDTGYVRGTKIGICGSANGLACWQAVPCYSPRPMRYLAGWRIELSPSTDSTLRSTERCIHDGLGSHWLDHGCNGEEWFDLDAVAATEAVSDMLEQRPSALDRHEGRVVKNDQFRNPHPRHLPTHPRKIVAWVYQEQFTGRLKTQVIDDWKTPRETRRRYSRNGFAAVAAFSYDGRAAPAQNLLVHNAWLEVMRELGPGADDTHYGWLNKLTSLEDVIDRYRSKDLVALDTMSSTPPEGVKHAYNRSE